eukprot:TRINITY_DN21697_c0_g1_i1.p1 TRINITY_DN21697_c0_g1~~TRINITY_DN21697_c0_g1_i1.p1  ORF type:complete len:333 (-),score=48.94 TRINITY_DN21697_c0_g1_i1:507-1505(-)
MERVGRMLTGVFGQCKAPPKRDDRVCPVTGLSADVLDAMPASPVMLAFGELEQDPDIVAERALFQALPGDKDAAKKTEAIPAPLPAPGSGIEAVPLNVRGGAHRASSHTLRLVHSIGGLPTLRKFTAKFYELCFSDPHLDQFIRHHHDEHGERFATWIAEKFGDGTPWTDERRSRRQEVMKIDGKMFVVAHDRSSAHFAAWHSHKRPAHKHGDHFKVDDARTWMRLHFWAARETGLLEPEYAEFMDYYVRFIGHFVSVYSSKAPPFTRESCRWSAKPANIAAYLAGGRLMKDVIGKSLENELAKLPQDERVYTGSQPKWPHSAPAWPYELEQ